MTQTPEQQAQVEQWRKEFEAEALRRNHSAILARSGNGYYIPTQNSAWGSYLAGREVQQREDAAKIDSLTRKTAVCVGVGNGSGRLFVYGDYDSIKAAQAIVLAGEKANTTIAQLQAQVREPESRLAADEPDEELRKAINVVEHNWPDSGYSMLREALTLLIRRASRLKTTTTLP